jgi:hypothetical protein
MNLGFYSFYCQPFHQFAHDAHTKPLGEEAFTQMILREIINTPEKSN